MLSLRDKSIRKEIVSEGVSKELLRKNDREWYIDIAWATMFKNDEFLFVVNYSVLYVIIVL